MNSGSQKTSKSYDTFTVQWSSVGSSGGRYYSSNGPSSAASKAATRIFRENEDARKNGTITLAMRKTTRGSDGHTLVYKATRKKLEQPKERVINGKTIRNEYEVDVKKVEQNKY